MPDAPAASQFRNVFVERDNKNPNTCRHSEDNTRHFDCFLKKCPDLNIQNTILPIFNGFPHNRERPRVPQRNLPRALLVEWQNPIALNVTHRSKDVRMSATHKPQRSVAAPNHVPHEIKK